MARILVVDDSPAMRGLLCATLRSGGYECIQAGDGVDALEQLSLNQVSLVITDLWMDGMDGLQLTQAIRKRAEFCDVPVLALTTDTSEKQWEALRNAGALSVLEKTVDPADLIRVVRRAIGST